MKRFISLIVIFLTICIYGFSEITDIFFSGIDGEDYYCLTKYENCVALEPSTYLEVLSVEPLGIKNTYAFCSVICEDLNKESQMRRLIAELSKQLSRTEYLKKNYKITVDDVALEGDKIVYVYQFVIE